MLKKISTLVFIIFVVTGQFIWPYIKILVFIPFAVVILSFYDPQAFIVTSIREAVGNPIILTLQVLVIAYFAFLIFWGVWYRKIEQAIKNIIESLMLVFAGLLALVFISGNFMTEIVSKRLKDQVGLIASFFQQFLSPGVAWGVTFFSLILGYNLLLMIVHFLFTHSWVDKKDKTVSKGVFWATAIFVLISPVVIFYLERYAMIYQDLKYAFCFVSALLTLFALRGFTFTILKTLLTHKGYLSNTRNRYDKK